MLPHPYRLQFAVRAAVLIVAGGAIAFTATMHDTQFSQVLFAVSVLAVAGGETVANIVAQQRVRIATVTIIQAALAVLAAVSTFLLLDNFAAFMITVTLWATLTAIVEVWSSWAEPRVSPGREIRLVGLFAGLLALLLVIVPSSPASVIGFFGGYCFVAGIYLAIASFDRVPTTSAESAA